MTRTRPGRNAFICDCDVRGALGATRGLEGGAERSAGGAGPAGERGSGALTLALPRLCPPTEPPRPRAARDAHGDSWSGPPPCTPGAQAGTTRRAAGWPRGGRHRSPALRPARDPSPLLTSQVRAAPRDEASRSVLRGAEQRAHDRAGSGCRPGASLPFTGSSPSPPIFRPRGGGARPAGGRDPGRGDQVAAEGCGELIPSERPGRGSHVAPRAGDAAAGQ